MTDSLPARVLDGTRAWLDDHLDHFDPYKDGELRGHCQIPLTELALLTLSEQRCAARPDRSDRAERRLALLERTWDSDGYRERPFREPETLVSHLIVAVALVRAGRLDPDSYREPFARLLAASTLAAPALPPHRLMELRHALDLAGVPHQLPSHLELYRATLASQPVNPIFVSTPEAYILTHVIFYATDVGRRPPLGIDAGEQLRLARLVERLLGMYLVAGNWDLAAELVLSSRCLGLPNVYAEEAWRAIAAAQAPDGGVPGIRWREGLDRADDAATRYHTTLVTAIAALAALEGGDGATAPAAGLPALEAEGAA